MESGGKKASLQGGGWLFYGLVILMSGVEEKREQSETDLIC